ncbi:MAG: sigma-54-dependent transcriptional regulator [Gemmatimonadota bacterium]
MTDDAADRADRIVIVEDDADLRTLLVTEMEEAGYEVRSVGTAEEAQKVLVDRAADLVISDLRLPGSDGLQLLRRSRALDPPPAFLVITAFGTIEKAVECLQEGADDFLTKPLDLEHLRLTVERTLRRARLEREVYRLREQLDERDYHGMVGRSSSMRTLFQKIDRIARTDGPVLVHGESGTGKELVARALHEESGRSDGPFLAVNCAGVPRELLESEFFGHVEGAFTGAITDREGIFAEAEGGTLLLDEVTEMPLDVQAKLLRVLQEGEVRRVGDSRVRPVDVRVVASSNRDVEEAVEDGQLREDLYFRLQTFTLEVPPLRDRGEDLELLAGHFLHRYSAQMDREIQGVASGVLDRLRAYPFPGNVRELENAIQRAVAFCQGDRITPADLPPRIRDHGAEPVVGDGGDGTSDTRFSLDLSKRVPELREVEDRYIRRVLEETGGNKRKAASLLGIGRRTLYRRLEREDEDGADE